MTLEKASSKKRGRGEKLASNCTDLLMTSATAGNEKGKKREIIMTRLGGHNGEGEKGKRCDWGKNALGRGIRGGERGLGTTSGERGLGTGKEQLRLGGISIFQTTVSGGGKRTIAYRARKKKKEHSSTCGRRKALPEEVGSSISVQPYNIRGIA